MRIVPHYPNKLPIVSKCVCGMFSLFLLKMSNSLSFKICHGSSRGQVSRCHLSASAPGILMRVWCHLKKSSCILIRVLLGLINREGQVSLTENYPRDTAFRGDCPRVWTSLWHPFIFFAFEACRNAPIIIYYCISLPHIHPCPWQHSQIWFIALLWSS